MTQEFDKAEYDKNLNDLQTVCKRIEVYKSQKPLTKKLELITEYKKDLSVNAFVTYHKNTINELIKTISERKNSRKRYSSQ